VRHFRLLLGDKPLEGEDIGLRPDSAAYLRHELNAEPFTEATLRLVEELIRFLRRSDVAVRLYLGRDPHKSGRNYFLHAKCYLFYGGGSGQSVVLDHLHPVVGIVGSSNFTGPGLVSNRELNLVHKTVLSVQQLRKVLQTYSSTNDVQVLIETVRDLYQHQGAFSSNSSSDTKHVSKIKRDDLNLICYEYIYA
jgi:phosphatidylserine/phosphatidylglycerophosphate/cardiolipin synthase-like enzyme